MINLINQIAQTWWVWMGPMFWQVSLLILVLAGIDYLIRKWAWPQVRYALWILVLIKLVIPPSFTLSVGMVPKLRPVVPVRVQTQWQNTFTYRNMNENVSNPAASSYISEARESVQAGQGEGINRSESEQKQRLTWQAYAFMIWFGGMVIFVVILTTRIKRLKRWHRAQKKNRALSVPPWFHDLLVSTATKMNIQRLPAIVFSDQAVTPAVYGFFQPVLLFPADYFKNLSRRDAEHVLLHELAHVKRGDLILHTITLGMQIVYWFNPLMIWARRHIKHIRELCCDLTVAGILKEKTSAYRQTLVDTARELLTESMEPGMGLLGVWEEPFRLVSRLKWLEKNTWQKRPTALITALFVSLFFAVSIMPMGLTKPDQGSIKNKSAVADDDKNEKQNSNISLSDISVKMTKPMTAVILPKIGYPDDMFEEAVAELTQMIKEQKIKPRGLPFSRYWSNPDDVQPHQRSWEVGYPVDSDVHAKPPLEIIHVPSRQVAVRTVEGIMNTEPLWYDFIQQIQDLGYVPAYPPAVEVYHPDPDKKEFWWHTEMQLQVFRPDQGYPGLDIQIEKMQEISMLILPMRGSYAKYPEALERLKRYVRENKIKTTGTMISRHFSDPGSEKPSDFVWEVGCTVQPGILADLPFKVQTIYPGKVAIAQLNESPNRELPWTPFIYQNLLKGRILSGPIMEMWEAKPDENVSSVKKVKMVLPFVSFNQSSENENKAENQEEKSDKPVETSAAWAENLGKKMQTMGEDYGKSIASAATGSGDSSVFLEETMKFTGGLAKTLAATFGARLPEPEIRVKELRAFKAVILPMKGSYDQHVEAVEELLSYMEKKNIEAAGSIFGRYFHAPGEVPEEEMEWEVGIPVKKNVNVEEPFQIQTRGGEQVAYSIIPVPGENTESYWYGFILTIMEKGMVPAGPPMEIWYDQMPGHSGDSPRTEMCMPVAGMPKNTQFNIREE